MEAWQKFKPPQKTRIWGLGIISSLVIAGLRSSNSYVFYGSIIYFGMLLILFVLVLILKIIKRKNDVQIEFRQHQIMLEREELSNLNHALNVKERGSQIEMKKKLLDHYFEILKFTKPIAGNVSTYFVSEVETHALTVIAKLQCLSNAEQSENKQTKLDLSKQMVTHEEL
jgi:hypothetical protein